MPDRLFLFSLSSTVPKLWIIGMKLKLIPAAQDQPCRLMNLLHLSWPGFSCILWSVVISSSTCSPVCLVIGQLAISSGQPSPLGETQESKSHPKRVYWKHTVFLPRYITCLKKALHSSESAAGFCQPADAGGKKFASSSYHFNPSDSTDSSTQPFMLSGTFMFQKPSENTQQIRIPINQTSD